MWDVGEWETLKKITGFVLAEYPRPSPFRPFPHPSRPASSHASRQLFRYTRRPTDIAVDILVSKKNPDSPETLPMGGQKRSGEVRPGPTQGFFGSNKIFSQKKDPQKNFPPFGWTHRGSDLPSWTRTRQDLATPPPWGYRP